MPKHLEMTLNCLLKGSNLSSLTIKGNTNMTLIAILFKVSITENESTYALGHSPQKAMLFYKAQPRYCQSIRQY